MGNVTVLMLKISSVLGLLQTMLPVLDNKPAAKETAG